MRVRALALVALLAAAGACTSDDDGTATPTGRSPSTVAASGAQSVVPETSAATGSTTTADAGSDQARRALDEVVDWFADPATADPAAFADVFLQEVPIEQLRQILSEIGPGAWTAVGVESIAPGAVAARLEGPGPPLLVQLQVDAQGLIAGLMFQPAELTDAPADLAGLVQRIEATAPIAGFLRADVAPDGSCSPVAELASTELLPIGSAFKLYVLGAVASMIEAGELGWDDPVVIRDELDSLPSGETQDDPAGSTQSVRELATRMISISDNTATDHLIDVVGRGRVEEALVTLGHGDPAATTPMLTTREMFVIKTDPGLLARYQAADAAARRALLDGEVAAAPLPSVADFPSGPTAVTTVEWFASPADLCRALVTLDDLAGQPGLEPVRAVLSDNPSAATEGDFERILFKGGSEPGVLFAGWLATRPDGSRIVVTGGVADETAPIDPHALQLLALGLTLS